MIQSEILVSLKHILEVVNHYHQQMTPKLKKGRFSEEPIPHNTYYTFLFVSPNLKMNIVQRSNKNLPLPEFNKYYLNIAEIIPYSGKFSREKTFADQ